MDAADAVQRLPGAENTVWELMLHLAYTRHILLNRLGESSGRFPRRLAKAWWPALPTSVDENAWRGDQRLLAEYHARLVDAVQQVPLTRLAVIRPGKRIPLHREVAGCAAHDIYHTGQIRLIRRSQTREGTSDRPGARDFPAQLDELFSIAPRNTFAVKLAYWLSR